MKSPFRLFLAVAMLVSAVVPAGAQSVTVPHGYEEGMNVVDGISIVATPEQWDKTCYALQDSPTRIVGIEIVADLDLSDPPTGVVFHVPDNEPNAIPEEEALVDSPELKPPIPVFHKTIATLPVPLNGNGHRIVFHNNTEHKPLIDTITEKGSVRNLSVCIEAEVDHSATFGGLARVNKGTIDGVFATVDLSLDLKEIIMKSMEQDCKVMIGGLVGENLGTISSCHVAARIQEAWSELDAAQMAPMSDGRQKSEVKIESTLFIKSFLLGIVAGHSHGEGKISDCYVGNVIQGEPVSSLFVLNKIIVYEPTQATRARLDQTGEEGGKPKAPDLSVSWLGRVDKSDAGVVNLCPPQMLAEASTAGATDDGMQDPHGPGGYGLWKQGVDVVFRYGNDSYSLAEKWDEASRNSMTPLSLAEDDALSPLWATDDNLSKFKDPAKWTFNVGPVPDMRSNHFCRYPVPTMRDREAAVSVDEVSKSVSVSVSDTSALWGVFNMLADANTDFYRAAKVTMPQGLAFAAGSLNFDTLTNANIAAALDSLPAVPSFRGSFDGAEVRNLAARASGLFDSVAVGGRVSNLALTDALFCVSPADSRFRRLADTVHVHLLAGVNSGSMTDVAVFGNVIVDEQDLKKLGDTAVVISLVGENDGERLSGYIFIDSLLSTGTNKKMIPIKQNLATGRNKKRSNTKVAARNSAVATTPAPCDTAEYSQGECLFSDEQFADGTVANWLNHQGAGFSGAYRPYWAQGERVPVPAADSTAALYRVRVSIKRGVGNADTTLRHPAFANGGDSITIRYASKPARVLMGNRQVEALGDSSATFVYCGGKTIEVEFGPTGIEAAKCDPLRVVVAGGDVVVCGAEGKVKRLFDAGGRMLAETRADKIRPPRRGLFVVWCDGRVAKVAVGR